MLSQGLIPTGGGSGSMTCTAVRGNGSVPRRACSFFGGGTSSACQRTFGLCQTGVPSRKGL
ncbi:MAG: hypothetical protein OXC62_04360, partial [Aestuariivita sp.]|nr:hypothetical protein [Aestuariivita sp.]